MSSLLPDLLLADHKRILSHVEELKAECNRDNVKEQDCFALFRTLKALTTAHNKAKEYTVYALFDEDDSKTYEDLREFIYKSYEEHDLIDLLLKEMGQAEELMPSWRAKLTVVTELLDHHIKEEQAVFIPKIREALKEQELLDLGVVYERERDEIFAKKSGLKKQPARPVSDLTAH